MHGWKDRQTVRQTDMVTIAPPVPFVGRGQSMMKFAYPVKILSDLFSFVTLKALTKTYLHAGFSDEISTINGRQVKGYVNK